MSPFLLLIYLFILFLLNFDAWGGVGDFFVLCETMESTGTSLLQVSQLCVLFIDPENILLYRAVLFIQVLFLILYEIYMGTNYRYTFR